MQVFRSHNAAPDNTEYPSKHNVHKHRMQRQYFSDTGPLMREPSVKPATSPGMSRLKLKPMKKKGLNKTQPLRPPSSSSTLQRDMSHPSLAYSGNLRYKGNSVKYLQHTKTKLNRPGYWPNCLDLTERWENYRTHQWEDNRYAMQGTERRKKAAARINKSNRSPFQLTPYSEQSPTMLFYQQKLSMSRSMPTLRPKSRAAVQNQEARQDS